VRGLWKAGAGSPCGADFGRAGRSGGHHLDGVLEGGLGQVQRPFDRGLVGRGNRQELQQLCEGNPCRFGGLILNDELEQRGQGVGSHQEA
jgi:hypothetical protein